MKRNKMRRLLITIGLTFVSCLASAQVLEVSPEYIKPSVIRKAHTGIAYNGSTGLVTIPTPDFQDEHSFGMGYKSGSFNQDIWIGGKKVDMDKDEQMASIHYNFKPNLEVSVVNMSYKRSSDPKLPELNYREDSTALGMKYSAHNGDKDICFGFTFAPMTASELNLADIEQIENMRNVYMTVSETVTDQLTGYMNLTSAFTKKQKITFANGITTEIDRKDILIGSLGLEYTAGSAASFFCEAKFGNYRDIFKEDSARHRINAGIRIGADSIQAEILGLNLSEANPTVCLGANVAY